VTTGRRTKVRVRVGAGEEGRKPWENRLMDVRKMNRWRRQVVR
jgi:hypothetical protein